MSDNSPRGMEHTMGHTECPECGELTNKFVGKCGVCGHNRWGDDNTNTGSDPQ